MRLRQFAGFIPLLIPWYQITLPSLPFSFQYLTPFDACYAAYTQIAGFRVHQLAKSSGFFSPRGGNSFVILFDQYRYLKQPEKIFDGDGF